MVGSRWILSVRNKLIVLRRRLYLRTNVFLIRFHTTKDRGLSSEPTRIHSICTRSLSARGGVFSHRDLSPAWKLGAARGSVRLIAADVTISPAILAIDITTRLVGSVARMPEQFLQRCPLAAILTLSKGPMDCPNFPALTFIFFGP